MYTESIFWKWGLFFNTLLITTWKPFFHLIIKCDNWSKSRDRFEVLWMTVIHDNLSPTRAFSQDTFTLVATVYNWLLLLGTTLSIFS